jgi:hypothetical protein
MLNGTLVLHDPRCTRNPCHHGCITNVERFCGALLERRQIRVGDGEYEDTLAYLIAEAWIHAGNYDHHKDWGERSNMASWVAVSLVRAFTDRKRKAYRTVWKWKGRSYQRPLPQFVHPDEPGLDAALGRRGLEAEEPGGTDLGWLLRNRSGVDPRRVNGLGANGAREAAR